MSTRSTCGSRCSASSRWCSRSTSSATRSATPSTPRPDAEPPGSATVQHVAGDAVLGENTERKAGQHEAEQAARARRWCRSSDPRCLWRRVVGRWRQRQQARTGSSAARRGAPRTRSVRAPLPRSRAPTAGGTITVYLPGDPGPDTLDPTGGWSVTGNSIQQALTSRSLTQYVRDEDGQPVLVPDLATDLGTPNEDFTEWTFTIRDDATWEDGKPVTADEVAFGICRSLDSEAFPSGPGTEYSKTLLRRCCGLRGSLHRQGPEVRRSGPASRSTARTSPSRWPSRSRTWTTGAPSWRWARLRSATPPSRRTTASKPLVQRPLQGRELQAQRGAGPGQERPVVR